MAEEIRSRRVDFGRINQSALSRAEDVCRAFLPAGRTQGREYSCRNPCRSDSRPGSFKVNIATGKWCDFALASDAKGGDLISLVAYVEGLPQREAAIRLAASLGVDPFQ